jgi:hypothetical protein
MRISADHAFHIGSQHLRGGLPCQDYATSWQDDGTTCSVLSDGCSSGGNTDVGARIIALNTTGALLDYAADGEAVIDESCQERDVSIMAGLGLSPADMLATTAYVVHRAGTPELTARLIGDGVIASMSADGDILMERFDWASNMPFYRIYWLDGLEPFIAAHGGDAQALVATRHIHFRHPVSGRDEIVDLALANAVDGHLQKVDTRVFPFVAVFSDGVTQVDGMDWRDVVAELMAFKSTEGDFVKRRMNRFLKDCLKHGKGPVDDISMACIHIDHEAA